MQPYNTKKVELNCIATQKCKHRKGGVLMWENRLLTPPSAIVSPPDALFPDLKTVPVVHSARVHFGIGAEFVLECCQVTLLRENFENCSVRTKRNWHSNWNKMDVINLKKKPPEVQ